MIKIGICDDESFWIDQLQTCLLKYSHDFQKDIEIKTFLSAEDYLQKEEWVDVLLLDIEMDQLTGIDLKNLLAQKLNKEAIIFISNYSGLIREAFGKNVYGFIDKPVSEGKLFAKLSAIIEENETIVQIPVDNHSYIPSPEIICIKAINKYVEIHAGDGVHIGYFSLKECEKKLPDFSFKRIQKSFIINYEHLVTIKDLVELDNGFKIKVARGKLSEIKAGYMEYVKRRLRS